MGSLIPTEVANIVANAFQGKLMSGIMKRPVITGTDSKGDPIITSFLTYSVQGIRENFDAYYSSFNQIPNTDVKIMLIMNLTVPLTQPLQDDYIQIRGAWHLVRKVLEIDPASASINLQAFETNPPQVS